MNDEDMKKFAGGEIPNLQTIDINDLIKKIKESGVEEINNKELLMAVLQAVYDLTTRVAASLEVSPAEFSSIIVGTVAGRTGSLMAQIDLTEEQMAEFGNALVIQARENLFTNYEGAIDQIRRRKELSKKWSR